MARTAELAALTKIAAECHMAKWKFDFNDETRLPAARDIIKRAFCELHRIGDLALKERDALTPANEGTLASVQIIEKQE